jgi:hypothetical protein
MNVAATRALTVALALCPAATALSEPASPRPEDDERLRGSITVVEPRIYLGELAEKLTRLTGAQITVAEDIAPVTGIEVCCIVRAQPAHRVLRALSELHSTRHSQWSWQVRHGPEGPRYHLRPGRSLAAAAAAWRAEQRREWEKAAWEQYRISRLAESQRLSEAARRPDLFGTLSRPESWTGFLAAAELTPQEYARALRGEAVTVPLDRVSTAAQSRAAAEYRAERRRDPTGKVGPIRTMIIQDAGDAYPFLLVDTGSGGYRSVMGGAWGNTWLSRSQPGWDSPADPETMAAMKRFEGLGATGLPMQLSRGSRHAWLAAASDTEGFSILADVHLVSGTPGPMLSKLRRGKSPEDTIRVLSRLLDCCLRKKGEIWLLRAAARITDPRDYLVPWSTIRGLRASAGAVGGLLPLADLAKIAAMGPPQWLALMEEFPDVETERMEAWAPIFRCVRGLPPAQRARLFSDAGLAFRDMDLNGRKTLLPTSAPQPWPGARAVAADPRNSLFSLAAKVMKDPVPVYPRQPPGTVAPGRHSVWLWRVRIGGKDDATTAAFIRKPRTPLQVPATRLPSVR